MQSESVGMEMDSEESKKIDLKHFLSSWIIR
jgi:hypothetical protein